MAEIKMLKVEGGYAKGLSSNGIYVKSIGEPGAVDARIQGEFITIQYKNGATKMYSIQGTYVKTL